MTPQEELKQLREKLAGREGRPGFQANAEAIRRRIAELEGQNG